MIVSLLAASAILERFEDMEGSPPLTSYREKKKSTLVVLHDSWTFYNRIIK